MKTFSAVCVIAVLAASSSNGFAADSFLHLMDCDHERLTYRHSDRDYRLTDVEGHVVKEVLA